MKRFLMMSLCVAALAVAGCSDDDTTINVSGDAGSGGGGGGGTNDPGPGPANQVDAQIGGGGGGTTDLDGSADETVEGTNDAYVAQGIVYIALSTSDGTLITTALEPGNDVIPGTVAITGGGPDGSFVNITGAAGIFNSTGGSVTIDQCPTAGNVFTGSWDVTLEDAMGGGEGQTLTGTFRATVRIDDGSVVCREVSTGGGGSDAGGGGETCDITTCDGPCCDELPAVATCANECVSSFDPMNPNLDIVGCIDDCNDIFLEDPACADAATEFFACEDNTGCDDQFDEFDESDAYEACVQTACCDEYRAAF